MKRRKRLAPLLLLIVFTVITGAVQIVGVSAQQTTTLTGIFSATYADHPQTPQILYRLTTLDGRHIPLTVDESVLQAGGGLLALNGQPVRLELNAPLPALNTATASEPLPVRAIARTFNSGTPFTPGGQLTATDSQTWLNLLCRFSDIATEYQTPTQLHNFFGTTYPLMDHYWRETSYNQVAIADAVTQNWVSLPNTHAHYYNANTLDLESILTDCVAAYGNTINVSSYYAINIFLNGDLGGFFYGSSCQFINLQGTTKCWRATWLPITRSDVLYQDVIAHEMGHARGLPHSNNSDGDSDPYDNFYDLMSGHACGVVLAGYGCIGQHMIAAYKDFLGWLTPAQKYTVSANGTYTITLDRLALANSPNYDIAIFPITANHYFTVEARRNSDNDYDKTLPGSGVIIHEVDLTRNEPAWLTNGVTDTASRFGPGLWLPGETYTNYAYGFSVTVNGVTANGYSVTLRKGTTLPAQPDVNVKLVADSSPPNQANYDVQIANTGAGTATGVTLAFDMPFTFNSVTLDPALTCDQFLCAIGDLAPNEVRNYTVHAQPRAGGSTTVALVGALNETDPTPANNRASVTSTITVAPDIRVTLTHDSDVVDVGASIVNHIRVENVGGAAASNLNFSAPLPNGVVDAGFGWGYYGGGVNCALNGLTYTCTDATVNPGEYLYLDLYSYSLSEGGYNFTTLATISNSDANPADNSPSLLTTVGTSLGLQAKVTLQGRPAAPNALLAVPLTVIVTPSAGGTPVINTTVTTDHNGVFTLSGLSAGTYTVWVKHSHTLGKATTVTLPNASVVDLGTLREGDADGSNLVNLTDFSILATTFGKQPSDTGYDGRADFNGDSIVNLTDFSLLATNFGQAGDP